MKVKDEMAGRAAKCPDCGGRIQVPDDDVFDAQPYEDEGNPYAQTPAPSKRRPCPACGEMIMKKAAVCRFCHETFDGSVRSGRRGGSDIDDDMSTGDWVVAIICSGIGCIAGIVWLIQGKKKGGKMLGVSLLMVIIWNVIRFALVAANGGGNGAF